MPSFVRPWSAVTNVKPRRNLIALVALIAFGLALVWQLNLIPQAGIPAASLVEHNGGDARHNSSRQLHLLMHAPTRDVTLCKSITSGLALGYPSPVLVNWKADELVLHSDHLAKFEAFADYLKAIPPQQDRDLVLIADPYNTWFQLRPDVLIDRYLEINAKADQTLSANGSPQSDIDQTIVFAAQRECWPWPAKDPTCTAIPQSTLPNKIYGPSTDKYDGKARSPQAHFRQRYLNSGAYIGEAGAMRRLIDRARQIAKADRRTIDRSGDSWGSADWSTRSDQVIFQKLFKEQHLARSSGKCPQWESSGKRCEYNVGLDYRSSLFQAEAFSYDDVGWFRHDELASELRPSENSSDESLGSGDILRSSMPFASLRSEEASGWEQMPLFTNKFTNTVPVLLQHNIRTDNLRPFGEEQWSNMWFHSRIRDLLKARPMLSTSKEIARTQVGGEDVRWFPARTDRRILGLNTDKGGFVSWDALCQEWQGDIYRDRKDPSPST